MADIDFLLHKNMCGVNKALALDVKMLLRLDFQVYLYFDQTFKDDQFIFYFFANGHDQFWLEVKLNIWYCSLLTGIFEWGSGAYVGSSLVYS